MNKEVERINKHAEKIASILRDLEVGNITQSRMDLLITNELMGIQSQCEKLGMCFQEGE